MEGNMGLFDIFGGDKDERRRKGIEKAGQKLRNPHSQTQERVRFIEVLTDYGTPEAVTALIGRFAMRTPGAIVDEDEKRMVYETLVSMGDMAVEPLKEFILKEPSIYWPLRALTEIAGEEVAVDILLNAIDQTMDGFQSDVERREQLVSNLRECQEDPRTVEKLIELTGDESDDVRIMAIDGLAEFEDPRVVDSMVCRLEKEEETLRVKTTILDIMLARRISVKSFKERVSKHLPENYFVDDTGVIQRK
jgi:hypothetical protein